MTKQQPPSLSSSTLNRSVRVALVSFFIGSLISIGLFLVLRQNENQRLEHLFDSQTDLLTSAIARELDEQRETLELISAFFGASENVTREGFAEITRSHLEHDNSTQALEWVPRVSHNDLDRWIAAAQADGNAIFAIREQDQNGNLIPAAERAHYYPVYYVEPLDGNEMAIGFDLASDPIRLSALELAVEMGSAAATAPIILINETGEHPGFLIFWPIFNMTAGSNTFNSLTGFSVSVIRASDLINAAAEDLDILENARLTITDQDTEVIVYSPEASASNGSGFTSSAAIEFASRTWRLDYESTALFTTSNQSDTPWVVLASGLLFSLMLSFYLNQQANRRIVVERLVEQRTTELTDAMTRLQTESGHRQEAVRALNLNENRLQQIQEIARLGTWETDMQTGQTTWWGQMYAIYGVDPDAFSGQADDYLSWIHPDDRAQVAARQEHVLAHPQEMPKSFEPSSELSATSPIDFRILRPDRTVCHVYSDSLALTDSDGTITRLRGYIIDITELKSLEAAEREQRALAETLWKAAEQLNASLDPRRVLESILIGLDAVLDYDAANIMSIEAGMVNLLSLKSSGQELVQATSATPLSNLYFVQKVLASHQPVMIPDTDKELRWHLIEGREWIRSWACVPILSKGEVIGLLNVDSREVDNFDRQDLRRLEALATQASIALENAKLHEELQRQVEETQLLYRASFQLQQAGLTSAAVGKKIVEIVHTDFGAQHCGLLIVQPGNQMLVPISRTNPGEDIPIQPMRIDGPGLIPAAFRAGEAIYVPDVRQDPRFLGFRLETRSEMVIPLKIGNQINALINIESDRFDAFDSSTRRVLASFSERAALALENARLIETIQQNSQNAFLLNNIVGAALDFTDVASLTQVLADRLGELFGADGAYLTRWDDEKKLASPGAASGSLRDLYLGAPLNPGEKTMTSSVLKARRPLVAVDVSDSPHISPEVGARFPTVSLMGLPLIANEEQLGAVLISFHVRHEFTQEEIDLAARAASHAALALANADLLEQVQAYAQNLEIRVQQRTQELELAVKELEAFSYSVSHDLRAPLRSIDGFSQALLEDYDELLDDTGKNYLGRVRSSSQHMGQMIDDMLRLSRVTRTDLNLQSVALTQVAHQILEDLYTSEPERPIKIELQDHMHAYGDPRLLKIALTNLIGNAWKFTSQSEDAKIRFSSQVTGNEVIYIIKDNGVGFDMAYADKLFGPFERLHARTEFPGTGIGLATVQRIIQRHNGRIWAEASPGEGAAFCFTIAASQPDEHE
jgi:K+-sensing histidine kinase KdpD/CHASE1-domain containing sensor protein